MKNDDEEVRKELYDNMIKNSNSQKRKRLSSIWKTIESFIKTSKILIIVLIMLAFFLGLYFIKDSTNIFIDVEKSIENEVGKVTLVSEETDDYQNGIFTFKLDKIPEIKIHACKENFNYSDDGIARVCRYLFEKWDHSKKDKFVADEFYLDSEFNDRTINDWIMEYQVRINVTNHEELMEAVELIIDFAEYEEKMIGVYVNFPFSIQFNDEFISPYNESKDKISEYVQEWYEEIK